MVGNTIFKNIYGFSNAMSSEEVNNCNESATVHMHEEPSEIFMTICKLLNECFLYLNLNLQLTTSSIH